MTSAEAYAARHDAVEAQRIRLYGSQRQEDPWGGEAAAVFRFDPRRELDANLEIIASYVEPGDVFVDVGGGAGRVSLPMSLRCREVVCVDSSPGMGLEFDTLASGAGLTNARRIQSDWLEAPDVRGDRTFTADVTYFVRNIEAFINKLQASARRRVMITVWSELPPNRSARIFRLVYGEEQAILPGHRQLLPVLWDMGLLPDVRVLPGPPWWETVVPLTREEAVEQASAGRWLKPEDKDEGRRVIERHFDELFSHGSAGFSPKWRPEMRELLITWETQQGREGQEG